MTKSYGAIPNGELRRTATSSRALRVAIGSLLLCTVVITLFAVSRAPLNSRSRVSMMTTKLGLAPEAPDPQPLQTTDSDTDLPVLQANTPPTAADAATFDEQAKSFYKKIEVAAEKTELGDACGMSLSPCASQIGWCALGKITKGAKNTLTPSSQACNCLTRGYQDSIPVPNKNGVVFKCPLNCVNTIMKYMDVYINKANAPSTASSLASLCSQSMTVLTQLEFGNKRGYIPTADDVASLDVMPIDDPNVVRAGQALAQYIGATRFNDCPAKPEISANTSYSIVYAKKGIVAGGRGQYRMEINADGEIFFGRIAHTPRDQQTFDPSRLADDPENLEGRFTVMTITPEPCGDSVAEQLAVSVSGVNVINKQNLPWKASLKAAHEGRTVGSFGTGFRPLPVEERKQYTTTLDTTDFTPPKAYDARDIYATQQPCKAYNVLDQGGCGSCYAFSSATAFSARLCRFNEGSLGNIVASPQEMIDCTNGCDGGNPIDVFNSLFAHPAVEYWCDDYLAKKTVCGTVCGTSNQYTPQPASVRIVGGSGADGVKQIQLELLRSGPGVVSFDVYNDFQSYSSGVYVKSASAKKVGAHAVALVGFGEESDGKGGVVPYWLIQNSWGPNWGLSGFGKIRRGTDEVGIESYGLSVTKTTAPAVCASSACANGASTLKDCSCRCSGGWSGPRCDVCSLKCQNNGVLNDACSQCTCPPGYYGTACEGYFKLSQVASCVGDRTNINVNFAFGGTALPPTQKSYLGVYQASEVYTNKQKSAGYVCGTKYNAKQDAGKCPASGSFVITPPTTAGEYKIVLAPYLYNEFGTSGYPVQINPVNVIAQYTVLAKGCSASQLKAATLNNDPAVLFSAALTAAAAARTKLQSDMKARLDSVSPLLQQLQSELPPSLSIMGINPNSGVLWVDGPPSQVCYRVPPSQNTNPKALFLYVGGPESASYYPTGLNGGGIDSPLPATYQECVWVNVASGIPSGAYTMKMAGVATNGVQTTFASVSFNVGQATVGFYSYTISGTALKLSVGWNIDSSQARPTDTVKIMNSAGTVTYWFYTSCGCQSTPAAAAVPQGTLEVAIYKTNFVPGGYKVKLFPGGADAIAAVSVDWIDWVSIGW